MLPIWLLAAMMKMMYYWRFWEPWANAMLAILLPKLWFVKLLIEGFPYPPWFLFWKKSFTLGGSMLKPFFQI